MRKFALLSGVLAAMLVLFLPAAPAHALNSKSFVSSTGSDFNSCIFAQPCLTIGVAVANKDNEGEINCLDSGPVQGAISITKSVTVDCAVPLMVVPTGFGNVFNINGPGVIVRLRNLTINGAGAGFIGISFQNGAALFVENCFITNFNSNLPALGIRFNPTAAGSQLVVTDTVIQSNGTGSTGGGIQIAPAGGSAGVVLNRVQLGFNVMAMVISPR